MIKEIPKSDVVVRPFKVYKEWTLDENDVTAIIGEKFTTSSFDEDTAVSYTHLTLPTTD